MSIDSFEKYQQLLVEVAQPLALAAMQNDRQDFGKSLHSLLFDEQEEQVEVTSSFKRRDDQFVAQLFLDFSEISSSYYSLQDIVIYIRRFPYGDTDISRLRYLQYHIENHLQEIYVLKERMNRYLTFIERRYRNSARKRVIDTLIPKLRAGLEMTLKPIIEARGAHVHERRFSDKDFDKLRLLEMLKLTPKDKGELLEHFYDLTYQEIRTKWRMTLETNNSNIKKLLDGYCNVLINALFDEDKNIIFP